MLDWGDELSIKTINEDKIYLNSDLPDVHPEEDLIYRAAVALKQATGCKLGAEISISKTIPTGGGLGGGSSNAATTLVALNYQWNLNLTVQKLIDIGVKLGADVPIFVKGHTAFADGVGEIITPSEQREKYFLIVHPNCHVSTAQAFASKQLKRNTEKINPKDYNFSTTRNDFEPVVKSLFTEVANAFSWLVEYAPTRLTGTGACLFAVFESETAAQAVCDQVPKQWTGYVAKGVNLSPLQDKLMKLNKTHSLTED